MTISPAFRAITLSLGVLVVAFFAIGLDAAKNAIPGSPTAAPDATLDANPASSSAAPRRGSLLTVMRQACQPGGALTDGHDGTVTLVLHDVGVQTDEFEDPIGEINSAECVLNGIGMPRKVAARIGQASASDGWQRAAWGNFTVSWTAHPHDGLNLVITEN